jgi:hypothetical protein
MACFGGDTTPTTPRTVHCFHSSSTAQAGAPNRYNGDVVTTISKHIPE